MILQLNILNAKKIYCSQNNISGMNKSKYTTLIKSPAKPVKSSLGDYCDAITFNV